MQKTKIFFLKVLILLAGVGLANLFGAGETAVSSPSAANSLMTVANAFTASAAHAIATNVAEDCTSTDVSRPLRIPFEISDTFGSRILHPNGGSRYDFHRGVDWPAPQGTYIYAVADGVVVDLEKNWVSGTGAGNFVLIYHEAIDCETRYVHMDSVAVSDGQTVSRDDIIGTVGDTGATYDHLHFEVRKGRDGTQRAAIHPLNTPFLPFTNVETPDVEILGAFPDDDGLTALVEVTSVVTEPDIDDVVLSIPNVGEEKTLDMVALNAATTAMGLLDDPVVTNSAGNLCLIPYDLDATHGYRTIVAFRNLAANSSSVLDATVTDFAGLSQGDSLAVGSGASVMPLEQSYTAVPQEVVPLSFTLSSSSADTYDLEFFSAQGWAYTLSSTQISLGAGGSAAVTVDLTVDNATFGPGDCGFLLATPQSSSGSPVAGYYHVARDAYVSTSGSDSSGTGGQSAPFATIDYAVDQTDTGGTIHVASGTYHETVVVTATINLLGGYNSSWSNRTLAQDNTVIDAGGSGTTLEVQGDHGPLIEGFTITGGSNLDGSGGGVRLVGGAAPTLATNWIVGNAAEDGGGLYVAPKGSQPPTLDNNLIEDNSSLENGGGLLIAGRGALLTNNTIRDNSAAGNGGGVYVKEGSDPSFTDNSISYNSAAGNGGGIYVTDGSTPSLTDNSIANNSASGRGGGVYLTQGSDSLLQNNSIANNSATNHGGGVYLTGGALLMLDGNLISGNTTNEDGGGVYAQSSTVPTILNNTISQNIASDDGAGVMARSVKMLIANNIFWGNEAGDEGHGIAAWSGNFGLIYHNTLGGNSATTGAGLYIDDGALPDVKNNIIVGYYLAVECDNGQVLRNTLIETAADVYGCAKLAQVVGHADLTTNYRLGSGSDARDAALAIVGVPELATDIDGDGRPFGSGPDIGADEFMK